MSSIIVTPKLMLSLQSDENCFFNTPVIAKKVVLANLNRWCCMTDTDSRILSMVHNCILLIVLINFKIFSMSPWGERNDTSSWRNVFPPVSHFVCVASGWKNELIQPKTHTHIHSSLLSSAGHTRVKQTCFLFIKSSNQDRAVLKDFLRYNRGIYDIYTALPVLF